MAIKIEMLRCFVTVAHHGSLSDAADALGRTPSAVSMMLKQFEDHVGSPLFETARKSRLTPLGDAVFEEARRAVGHFESSVTAIEGLARADHGSVRLAVTPSVATTLLPSVIIRFSQQHPEVQIDIRDMDSATITRELVRERADIGIGTLGAIDGMTSVDLFDDAFGVVCRRDHALAQNWDQLTWRDMHDQVFIANGLCGMITDPDFAPILAASRLMMPNTASLLALIREGGGITVLPKMAVSDTQDDIVFLPLVDVNARRSVQMVSKPHSSLLPAARAFLQLVADILQEGALNPLSKFSKSEF